MKTTDCVYRVNPVPLGRARRRCPACGATLQDRDPAGHHYIAPPLEKTSLPRHEEGSIPSDGAPQ